MAPSRPLPPVVYHPDAVVELLAARDKQARKKVLTVISILQQTGTSITEPHAKKVRGSTALFELRPGGGRALLRPLYAHINGQLVILSIAPEAVVDRSGFNSAVDRAKRRAKEHYGADV